MLLDRDALLNNFSNWKRVKADLETMDQQFELLPLLDDAMSGIQAINHPCAESDLDKALVAAPILATALSVSMTSRANR